MKNKIKNITIFDSINYSNIRHRKNIIKYNKTKKVYTLPKNIILNLLNEYCKFKKKSCTKIIKIPNKKRNLKKFKKIKI